MTEGLECPICKDKKTNTDNSEDCFVETKKGHVFHYECIQKWVDEGKTQCPNCPETLGRTTVLRLIGVQRRRVSLHQEALTAQLKTNKSSLIRPTFYDQVETFKIVALGDPGVGKSSLIKRFSSEIFEERYNATIGCDMSVKTIEVAGKLVQMHLWETSGQERFTSLTSNYVRNANGILLVYDVTNLTTLKSVERWLQFANDFAPPDAIKILIGNKREELTKERCMVSKRKGKELADKLEIPFFECSAKSGQNVPVVFRTLAAEILLNPQTSEKNRDLVDEKGRSFSISQPSGKKKSSKKCC